MRMNTKQYVIVAFQILHPARQQQRALGGVPGGRRVLLGRGVVRRALASAARPHVVGALAARAPRARIAVRRSRLQPSLARLQPRLTPLLLQ